MAAQLIKLYEQNIEPRKLEQAVAILKKGGIIVYPTDTVYAMGCDITNTKALQRLAQIKQIKLDKAKLSFMCNDFSHLCEYVKPLDNHIFKTIKSCLPGPYTFILKGNNNLPKVFKNKKTVGIRIPNNKIALAIIEELGNPIVCTSVHHEDEIIDYITDPTLILDKYKKQIDLVIDGDVGGLEPSTVVDLCDDEPVILRAGKGDFFQ